MIFVYLVFFLFQWQFQILKCKDFYGGKSSILLLSSNNSSAIIFVVVRIVH